MNLYNTQFIIQISYLHTRSYVISAVALTSMAAGRANVG